MGVTSSVGDLRDLSLDWILPSKYFSSEAYLQGCLLVGYWDQEKQWVYSTCHMLSTSVLSQSLCTVSFFYCLFHKRYSVVCVARVNASFALEVLADVKHVFCPLQFSRVVQV